MKLTDDEKVVHLVYSLDGVDHVVCEVDTESLCALGSQGETYVMHANHRHLYRLNPFASIPWVNPMYQNCDVHCFENQSLFHDLYDSDWGYKTALQNNVAEWIPVLARYCAEQVNYKKVTRLCEIMNWSKDMETYMGSFVKSKQEGCTCGFSIKTTSK